MDISRITGEALKYCLWRSEEDIQRGSENNVGSPAFYSLADLQRATMTTSIRIVLPESALISDDRKKIDRRQAIA